MKRFPSMTGTASGWLALATTLVVALAACGGGGGQAAASEPPASTSGNHSAGVMRELTSVQLSQQMAPGINLGNTLQQAAINGKITKFWTQIANTFKGYDDYLLFAGLNEVGMDAPWGTPVSTEWASVQNSFNQAFVDAVRATGGNNAKRHLVVQAYWTSVDYATTINTVPTDTADKRLFMEVHYYDPFDFTINGDSSIWQWGAIATDPSATETWANEPYVDAAFQKMKTHYVDKGVGVILGEYGVYQKPKYPDMGKYVNYWAQYITHSAYSHGAVPIWWDTGAVIDRSTGAVRQADVVKSLVDGAK